MALESMVRSQNASGRAASTALTGYKIYPTDYVSAIQTAAGEVICTFLRRGYVLSHMILFQPSLRPNEAVSLAITF